MPLLRALPHALPVRNILGAIALIAILPALAFSAVLLLRYADSERDRSAVVVEESAKAIARAIDAEFSAAEGVLLAVSSSSFIDSDNLQALQRRVRRVASETGRSFVIVHRDGQIILDTTRAPDAELPRIDPNIWARTFQDGMPWITNVVAPTEASEAWVDVGIPVRQEGEVRWALLTRIFSEDFKPVIEGPGVPPSWIVSIVDREGVHLTRSRAAESFVGKPLAPELLRRIKTKTSTALPSTSLEGVPLMSSVAIAPASGWVAAIGLPRESLEGPLRRSFIELTVVGAAVLLVTFLVIVLLSLHLDRALNSLRTSALSIADGEIREPAPCKIIEINTVAHVLTQVGHHLKVLTANLEAQVSERTRELSDTNAQLVEEIQKRSTVENQIRQMQKMDAIGQLTGGIAHDFNNMLSVILGSLRLIQRRLAQNDLNVEKYIEAGIHGAERAALLTSRLLAFARRQPLSPQVVDVNKVVSGMGAILRRTIPEDIGIETILAGGLWLASIDPIELENAIINIAVNARDAMAAGGKMTIETANAHLDESYAAMNVDLKAGQYVMIAITDTGKGMASDVLEKAFDPFFTTKEVGKGTGLGLSQVHGFIKQSGGHVKIYSEPGVGTTIKLYLPREMKLAASHTQAIPAYTTSVAPEGTVLIVEDDEEVRSLAAEMVRELGFVCVEAASGRDALVILKENPQITLLFTDVVMPDMNGRQLAEQAIKLRPKLRVLFTTGYTRNAIVHGGILDSNVSLLSKPYTLAALSAKFTEIMMTPD